MHTYRHTHTHNQAEALKAANDMAAILAEERASKHRVAHPNQMAALALAFNPVS